MERYQPDLAVYDSNDRLILSIDVNRQLQKDVEWATRTRRNFIVHGLMFDSPYFLLITPDRLYLWTRADAPPDTPPDYNIDATPILKPYFERANLEPHAIYGDSFVLLLSGWLFELIRSEGMLPEQLRVISDLVDAGLIAAIKNGHFVFGEHA